MITTPGTTFLTYGEEEVRFAKEFADFQRNIQNEITQQTAVKMPTRCICCGAPAGEVLHH
jgi:hypothetical protein